VVAADSPGCLQFGGRGIHLMIRPACRCPRPDRFGGASACSARARLVCRRTVDAFFLLGVHFCPGRVVAIHDYRPFTEPTRLVLVTAVAMTI
jgi:hypothetical protein